MLIYIHYSNTFDHLHLHLDQRNQQRQPLHRHFLYRMSSQRYKICFYSLFSLFNIFTSFQAGAMFGSRTHPPPPVFNVQQQFELECIEMIER